MLWQRIGPPTQVTEHLRDPTYCTFALVSEGEFEVCHVSMWCLKARKNALFIQFSNQSFIKITYSETSTKLIKSVI